VLAKEPGGASCRGKHHAKYAHALPFAKVHA
jgi:hypothetical protein